MKLKNVVVYHSCYDNAPPLKGRIEEIDSSGVWIRLSESAFLFQAESGKVIFLPYKSIKHINLL